MAIKILAGVVIAYGILRLVAVAVYSINERAEYKKWVKRNFPERPSEYREAFIMECSEDMIAENQYAAELDKKIRKIDADTKAMKEAAEKMERRWAK